MDQRVYWVDYAKFFGIFLVVIGHTHLPTSGINFIYSFHMPLFFFISGFLFKRSKFSDFRVFALHRAKQLIVPYLWLALITYLFWLFIGRKFGDDHLLNIPFYKPIIGTFYGADTDNFLIHCGPLWFLPCLFIVELIYFKLSTSRFEYWMLIACVAIGYSYSIPKPWALPFSADIALIALAFYALGNLLKGKINLFFNLNILPQLFVCMVSFVIFYFSFPFNGRIDMGSNNYGNFFLFLINALLGIIFILSLSMLLDKWLGKSKIIIFFSVNTLIILAFHIIVGSLIKGIGLYILKVPVDIYNNKIILNIIYTLFTFILLTPAIWIINSYFPFIIGKKYKN